MASEKATERVREKHENLTVEILETERERERERAPQRGKRRPEIRVLLRLLPQYI